MRNPAAMRRPARVRLAPALTLLVAGCVTTYTPVSLVDQASQAPVSLPVSIPIPAAEGGSNQLLMEFYSGILRRLQDAAEDGDVALLDSLVESYDKPDIPESVAQHLAGYRAMSRGLRFSQHVVAQGVLELRAPDLRGEPAVGGGQAVDGGAEPPAAPQNVPVPALGADLQLQLRIPAMTHPVVLGGREDRFPVSFSVAVSIEDEYSSGGSRSLHTDAVVWLPETFELVAGNELCLPIEIEAASDDAVRRNVTVRVDMRGHVLIDDLRAPIKSTAIGAGSFTQWPTGYEILAKQPLAALRLALASFEPKNFASVYLAALMIPKDQQLEACRLLVDQVRFGRVEQARVAMAALQNVTGLATAVGDRDAWLTWWQSHSHRQASSPTAEQPGR